MKTTKKITVIRDSREKINFGWTFPFSSTCDGTIIKTLESGDYTIAGLEKKFVIERKGALSEFSINICEERFWNEMKRLESYEHAFLVLEFTLNDIYRFPYSTDIPKFKHASLRVKPNFILKKLAEIELQYKTKVVFVDKDGEKWAENIFKYVNEKYNAN